MVFLFLALVCPLLVRAESTRFSREPALDNKKIVDDASVVKMTLSLADCARGCHDSSICMAFLHNQDGGRCHMMASLPSDPQDCVEEQGNRFYAVYKATTTTTTTTTTAAPVCPSPTFLPNAQVSSGYQFEGSERSSYTCNHGYLDTTRDTNVTTVTCLSNLKWSSANLDCSGPYIRLDVPPTSSTMNYAVPTEALHRPTSVVFLVKTCKDANFDIRTNGDLSGNNRHLWVSIGGWTNTKTGIVDRGTGFSPHPKRAEFDKDSIVSCSEYRAFWLDWTGGTISAGEGTSIQNNVQVSWVFPGTLVITSLKVNNYVNSQGTWLFFAP